LKQTSILRQLGGAVAKIAATLKSKHHNQVKFFQSHETLGPTKRYLFSEMTQKKFLGRKRRREIIFGPLIYSGNFAMHLKPVLMLLFSLLYPLLSVNPQQFLHK